ncbi:hypothetical protein RA19_10360 [Leisingera sp. ANG-M1]|uniref:hypothetical protein n=1 Tax=Leisingera sp. ANG-M1 TaxID=1577895 RepID=UPI00057F0E2E|nr:hypothetical protein [Leisingera sp. ANG-M1]KIC10784.1 hypothetical protein RA19_10360 [Leisingera sp. ANG-M1]
MPKKSLKPRLSEETIKRGFKDLNRKKLLSHLKSFRITPEDVDRLVLIMRQGALRLIKHPNEKEEAKRASCVEAIVQHIQSEIGTEEAQKVSDLMVLIGQIETGYREIISATDTSPGASLSQSERITAILLAGEEEAAAHSEQIAQAIRENGPLDVQGLSLPGLREGERVDPEVYASVSISNITMSLLMEGFRGNLFNKEGLLTLPAPIEVSESEVNSARFILFFAASWRFWEFIEEDTRYFGGNIDSISGQAVPPEYLELGITKIWRHTSTSLEWSKVDLAANQRLAQGVQQNYFEMVNNNPASQVVGVEGASSLAPTHFISAEEMHSLWILEQTLSLKLSEHPALYSGLTLLEWLRGYSALRAFVENSEQDGAADTIHTSLQPRKKLIKQLQSVGLKGEAAEKFLKVAMLSRTSRDLFDTPLIGFKGDLILAYKPAIQSAIAAQVILSRISSLKKSFAIRGKAFEKTVLDLFKSQGLSAVSVKETHQKEEYDYDVLVRWDPYVFLFECKSRSLSGGNVVGSYRFQTEVSSQVKQVKRLVNGLNLHPDILERNLGKGASKLKLVPCVINALPFSLGNHEGIYFTDFSGVRRLFESGSFNMVVASKNTPSITLPKYRLWKEDKVGPDDLFRQVERSPQLRMAIAEMRPMDCSGRLSTNIVAETPRIVRHPLSHLERMEALK